MSTLKAVLVVLMVGALSSCQDKQTLQEYYIDSKENDAFIMVDLPTSLIAPVTQEMTEDQKRVINSVKKVNLLAYSMKDSEFYNSETVKVKEILADDDYEELMKFGKPGQRMRLFIKGQDEAIDEVVVFAQDENKGFVLARVLGDKMNVADMVRFAETMDTSSTNFNTAGFEGVMDVFKNK
ncbi:DUF4252 domain-containing protein [Leeuwenhoekiella sp. W20_SRS_FM14]|uniref:DUF4252 domain-containing protein n=1 Tax=Leeuwenhoekiella sp. W20_SRS_FM14 TaxID=3240270 RepID=UPI003F9C8E57